jgi:hypothetical protein
MKRIKRSECAILPLVLEGEWYDMIASGEKKEEYRDRKPHWNSRVINWIERSIYGKSKVVGFSLGYKKADMFYTVRGVHEASGSIHPEWGEPETPHYVIQLGERVELVD